MDKQKSALAFAFLIFIVIALFVYLPQDKTKQNVVCFSDKCFSVELALTDDERSFGLMNRTHLDADKGMLFVFEREDVRAFWMKNTLIPLDMIWIDSNHRVVHIQGNAEPCTSEVCPLFNPGEKAKYVLEINGGLSEELGIKEGDSVTITA